MFDRFTDRGRELVGLAYRESLRLRHDFTGPEHVLLGLLNQTDSAAVGLLHALGIDIAALRLRIERALAPGNAEPPKGMVRWTQPAILTVDRAVAESEESGEPCVGTEHVLLALARDEGTVGTALRDCGLDYARALDAMRLLSPRQAPRRARRSSRAGGRSPRASPRPSRP